MIIEFFFLFFFSSFPSGENIGVNSNTISGGVICLHVLFKIPYRTALWWIGIVWRKGFGRD